MLIWLTDISILLLFDSSFELETLIEELKECWFMSEILVKFDLLVAVRNSNNWHLNINWCFFTYGMTSICECQNAAVENIEVRAKNWIIRNSRLILKSIERQNMVSYILTTQRITITISLKKAEIWKHSMFRIARKHLP